MAFGVGSRVHAVWGLPPQSPPLSLPRNPKGTSGGQRGLVIASATHSHGPTPGTFTPVACRPQLLPLKFQSPKIRLWGGGVGGCRASCRERLDLLVLLRSSLGVPSSFLLSSSEEDPDLASFPRRG